MPLDDRLRAFALCNGLLAVANLAYVAYRIFTYESPDTGGEDIMGLFFAIAIVLAGVVLVDAVLAGLVLWAGVRSAVGRGLTGGGLAAATLTGLGVTAFQADLSVGISPGLVRTLFLVGVAGGLALGLALLVTLIERYRSTPITQW